MSKLKKIGIITIAILIMLGIAYGVWFLFFASGEDSTTTPPETDENGEVRAPAAPTEINRGTEEGVEVSSDEGARLVRVSDVKAFDFWVSDAGDPIFLGLDGRTYKAGVGNDEELSTQRINALNQAKPAPDGSRALVSFGDPKNPDWSVFNVSDSRWNPLPGTVVEAGWETAESIFVITDDSEGRRLERFVMPKGELITEGGVEREVLVERFTMRDIEINTLSSGNVLITEKPASYYRGSMWELELDTGQMSQLISPTKGLWVEVSADKELIFKLDAEKEFSILGPDMSQASRAILGTMPSKCGASESYIFCGVPGNFHQLMENWNMPENYLQEKFFTVDRLYIIDKNSDESILRIRSGTEEVPVLDISNVKTNNNATYFINKYDQALYRLSWPEGLIDEPDEATETQQSTSTEPNQENQADEGSAEQEEDAEQQDDVGGEPVIP